jgi:polar amino acid transport system ATP-binding protein
MTRAPGSAGSAPTSPKDTDVAKEADRGDRHPLIRAEGIGVRFGRSDALCDMDFEVHRGEDVAVIGPSGSGKSTLLRCLNLLQLPTSGRLLVDGEPVVDVEAGKFPGKQRLTTLRRQVGMVFQSFNLFPHLTAVENVTLGQIYALKRSKEEARQRAGELLDRVGLAGKADHRPAQCSGGEQQRIAIARALALDPRLMLFDEPTSAIDPELGYEVLTVMRELAQEGMTMVVVTHEMRFAEDVSNRVIFMSGGKVVEAGTAHEVFHEPRHDPTKRFLKAVLER